jgi:hypothetical protein
MNPEWMQNKMLWFPQFVFYLGIFDAGIVMLGGLVSAFIILMGWDAKKLWERIFPAASAIIVSNIAAAIILAATRWLGGLP